MRTDCGCRRSDPVREQTEQNRPDRGGRGLAEPADHLESVDKSSQGKQ